MVKMDQLAHSLWDRILLIRRLFGRFCLCVLPVNLNLGRYQKPCCSKLCMTYVELPALDMLASLLACDDNNKLGDLAPIHPLLQLTHDLLDVRLDLVIGSHCEG